MPATTPINYVFEQIVEPLAKEFQPEIIIRNGGSDPHFNDGLDQLGIDRRRVQDDWAESQENIRYLRGKSYRPCCFRVSPGSITVCLDGIDIRIGGF